MQAISHFRPNSAQAAAVSATVIAAAALLGFVVAYWTWVWLAPGPEPRTPAAGPDESRAAGPGPASFAAFGRSGTLKAGATPGAMPAGPGSIRLLGVIAATGSLPAYAIVKVDGKSVLAVRTGEEVAPGIRLNVVQADRVEVERNGVRESLALPERAAAAAPPVPVPAK
jgi:general secretion pathway protein C